MQRDSQTTRDLICQALICQALPGYTISFSQRPDQGLLCSFRSPAGAHLFDRVIPRQDLQHQHLLDDLLGRIQRDLILEGGPLPEEQVDVFTKRIPLPTFQPGHGEHRQRKIVVAGDRLRRLAGARHELRA
ncbi:hypothetical protein HNP46_000999 [Pseudomonas nitritireducens]|uniref:DUF3509 domain-containing protein n=1 Tax=Pseudomonas nitroreducens TaxID=46680 RepID=A0A7W7NZ69_PSENT|nr:DUF3509 domain-containing protein [Pseudomonas nitritireducens]MBB4862161.1 hypothetical protein [Pseudomonas nitritireducens]